MADIPPFQQTQFRFAAHIRDPEGCAAPTGIEDRRMAIYRELFFNNLNKLLGNTFPVLRKICGNEGWRHLVRQFMIGHRAQTPYFLEIPREFVDFLQDGYVAQDDDPPFLLELAHYEWAELALSVSTAANDVNGIRTHGDLLEEIPVKSALAWSFAYRYPVHRISPGFRPTEPGEQATFLVIYRRSDDELGFMELNPVTARLLEMIGNNEPGSNGRALLGELAEEISWPDPASLVAHGATALAEMRAAEILLGTRAANRTA